MIYAIIGAVLAAYFLGYLIGYCVGRSDGEDKVARHYEAKRRKWASNEKGVREDCAEVELYESAPTFVELEKMAKSHFLSRANVRKSTWQTCQHAALLSLYKHGTVFEGGEERAVVPTDKVSVLYSGEVLERYVTSMKGVLQGVTIANTVMRIRSLFGEEYRKCYEKNGIVVKELPRVKVAAYNGNN